MDLALSLASRVVHNSSYTAGELEAFGVPPEKLVGISPGVDVERFDARVSSERVENLRREHALSDRPVILTVGRLIERKGVDKVIESLPLILNRFPQAVYLVVGNGPDRPRLEKLRDSLGLENKVSFAGFVPEDDLLAYYRLATLFAMVSRRPQGSHEVEGFGIVYLEANACGLPVVAGDSGGVSDAVLDGKTGYLVDPFDEDAIATAIIQLLENPELRDRLGGFGKARAIKEFSWERLGHRLQRVTEEVGGETSGRRRVSATMGALPTLLRRDLFA
jgi:phosphatidylinositol alpha-1,6-mannosyltransferase